MSARVVRRSFASPFVVTLVAALPAAACYVQPNPRTGGNGAQVTESEPRPNGNSSGPTGDQVANPQPGDHSTTNAGAEQAPPPNTTVISNPPRPAVSPVAKQDTRWTITRSAGTCSASAKVTCPTAPAGQPAPMCNPPPPTAYVCGPTMTTDGVTNIVKYTGRRDCQIEYPPMKCPAGAICNPPPPQRVDCPQ